MVCEFSVDCGLDSIRRCKITSGTSCSNWSDDELVKGCPSRKDYLEGLPSGGMSDLGYAGVPHVIRHGKYGSFAPGMPFEYLRGHLKAKGKKSKAVEG